MSVDLEEVANALDAFPSLEAEERAAIIEAYELAPVEPLSNFRDAETYFRGAAGASWGNVRTYVLAPNDDKRWAVTLDEAAGFESAPTKDELVKALHRGARMIR